MRDIEARNRSIEKSQRLIRVSILGVRVNATLFLTEAEGLNIAHATNHE